MMNDDPFQLVGTVIDGRYRVDTVIGEGGFGVVYKCFHLGFKAPIAIKVLKVPPRLSAKDRHKFLATFDEEGNLLFALSTRHPAFVRVTEKGVARTPLGADTPYLVLEWLDGESLEADLERRRGDGRSGRSLPEIISLLTPVAEALALAHDQKVAHRDVKPANIFLSRDRDHLPSRLLDFGIAKVMSSTGSAAVRDTTGKGGEMFSPGYSTPEQWDRSKFGATGPWTDVYAFALICVELLTDRAALEGDELFQFMGATTSADRPTPSARGATVPLAVDEVFKKALALYVTDRYPTLREFWSALLRSAEHPPREANGMAGQPPQTNTVPAAPLPLQAEPAALSREEAPHPPAQLATSTQGSHESAQLADLSSPRDTVPATPLLLPAEPSTTALDAALEPCSPPRTPHPGETVRATITGPPVSRLPPPTVLPPPKRPLQAKSISNIQLLGLIAVAVVVIFVAFGRRSGDEASGTGASNRPDSLSVVLSPAPIVTLTPTPDSTHSKGPIPWIDLDPIQPAPEPSRTASVGVEVPSAINVAETPPPRADTPSPPPTDDDAFDRTLEAVRLRAEPGMDSETLRTIPVGTKLHVMEEAWGGWVKVQVDRQTGYIHRSRLGRCDARKGDVDCRWLNKSCIANRCR